MMIDIDTYEELLGAYNALLGELEELHKDKDEAYWERNQLVAALSKLYPSWLSRHDERDTAWEDDWRWIVFIEISTKELDNKYFCGGFMAKHKRQISWHIHDNELENF